MKQSSRGRRALPSAATATAALVAAAATGLWVSTTSSGGSNLVGNVSFSGGSNIGSGNGAAVGVVDEVVEEETSSRDEIPLSTIVVVDAGSSGCRLNVYRVAGEVGIAQYLLSLNV